MWRRRLTHPLACLLLIVGCAATASAEDYSLCENSGGQIHIGKGLPFPIQPVAVGPAGTGTKLPELGIPVKAGQVIGRNSW